MAVALAASAAARRLLWRAGRRLYTYARGEGPNDPHTNGEYWLLHQVLARSAADPLILLDIGANRGDWTAEALRLSERPVRLHALEPSSFSRSTLMARFDRQPSVTVHSDALSNASGKALFYSDTHGAGTSSLSSASGSQTETVTVGTLDEFLQRVSLEPIAMVKIDAEGFDPLILRGAETCLDEGRVEVLQFEYNWRWLLNHACLRDVFEFLADKPYRIGKLTGHGLDYYDAWHPELDRFFETNFALVRRDSPLVAIGRTVHFDESNVATASRGPSPWPRDAHRPTQ